MQSTIPSISTIESGLGAFSRFLAKKVDWRYFQLCALASGMYLFNVCGVSLLSDGRLALLDSGLTSALASFPLLTLVYVTALLELMDLHILAGEISARLKKRAITKTA